MYLLVVVTVAVWAGVTSVVRIVVVVVVVVVVFGAAEAAIVLETMGCSEGLIVNSRGISTSDRVAAATGFVSAAGWSLGRAWQTHMQHSAKTAVLVMIDFILDVNQSVMNPVCGHLSILLMIIFIGCVVR